MAPKQSSAAPKRWMALWREAYAKSFSFMSTKRQRSSNKESHGAHCDHTSKRSGLAVRNLTLASWGKDGLSKVAANRRPSCSGLWLANLVRSCSVSLRLPSAQTPWLCLASSQTWQPCSLQIVCCPRGPCAPAGWGSWSPHLLSSYFPAPMWSKLGLSPSWQRALAGISVTPPKGWEEHATARRPHPSAGPGWERKRTILLSLFSFHCVPKTFNIWLQTMDMIQIFLHTMDMIQISDSGA